MITWNGNVTASLRNGRTQHFSIYESATKWRMCAGFASVALGGSYYHTPDVCAFGYFGVGPRMTAALMLLYAIRNVTSRDIALGTKFDLSLYAGNDPTEEERSFIDRHVDKFTREVIAKLPDTWTLGDNDIRDWISKQPKENENQTNQTNAGHEAEAAPVQCGQGSENRGG